jgi:hypothetical protein
MRFIAQATYLPVLYRQRRRKQRKQKADPNSHQHTHRNLIGSFRTSRMAPPRKAVRDRNDRCNADRDASRISTQKARKKKKSAGGRLTRAALGTTIRAAKTRTLAQLLDTDAAAPHVVPDLMHTPSAPSERGCGVMHAFAETPALAHAQYIMVVGRIQMRQAWHRPHADSQARH